MNDEDFKPGGRIWRRVVFGEGKPLTHKERKELDRRRRRNLRNRVVKKVKEMLP